jgi:cyclic pyranopterin phosphate synthase
MGQDKGLVSVHGRPMLIRQLERLSPVVSEILVLCSSEDQLRTYQGVLARDDRLSKGVRALRDESGQDRSPIYGIQKALESALYDDVIAVPVDAVGLDGMLLRRLGNSLGSPAVFQGGFPFPSKWHRNQAPILSTHRQGSVMELLEKLGAWSLETDAIERRMLSQNVNHPGDLETFFGSPLKDAWGRQLRYLRISITEVCNMACTYCLPRSRFKQVSVKQMMALQFGKSVLRAFRRLGFYKVRFTGGEPLLHPNALELIQEARGLGYETISMTTNGSLPVSPAKLKQSGLTHLNVSLDSLSADTFKRITDSSRHDQVMHFIDQALEAGFDVKVNTVLLRNHNRPELESLVVWAREKPITLRFIELMKTEVNHEHYENWFVSNREALEVISRLGYERRAVVTESEPAGPAVLYHHPFKPGRVGLISPLSCNFCDRCNRIRVTARGGLRLCLFDSQDYQLPVEGSEEELVQEIRRVISLKPEGHELNHGRFGNVGHFRSIGG